MASVLALLGLAIVVAVHTAIAAVLTRLLRVRLSSSWGPIVYAATLIPVVLVVSTLLLTGVLGLGANLGAPATALFVLVAIPLALGVTIDYVWMPDPDEVELPDTV